MGGAQVIGRYELHGKIASGGMAAVHLGRLLGPVGFSRTVAIKRMHPHLTEDPEFVSMFLDEARLAARVRHPNVVATLDIVNEGGELFLVMDYVQGETLARLLGTTATLPRRAPLPVVATILSGVLHGLHAAHEAKNEQGLPLGIVHRDVSPQNVIVGTDGVPRVLDFGVAKAVGRLQTTREGQLKGKLSYMAPEQVRGREATRRTDVYAASVVLWEALAGRRLFRDDNEGAILQRILEGTVEPPSKHSPAIPGHLDAIVLRGLSRDPDRRFATAREMANALEAAVPPALPSVVGGWVEEMAASAIASQVARILEIESASGAEQTIDAAIGHHRPDLGDAQTDVREGTTVVSQPSSVSLATPTHPPSPARPRRVALIVSAVAAVVVVVSVGALELRPKAPAHALAPSAPPLASMSPPPVDLDEPLAEPLPAPTDSAAPSPPTSAAPPASTSPPRGTIAPPPTIRKAVPAPAPTPSKKSSVLFNDPG